MTQRRRSKQKPRPTERLTKPEEDALQEAITAVLLLLQMKPDATDHEVESIFRAAHGTCLKQAVRRATNQAIHQRAQKQAHRSEQSRNHRPSSEPEQEATREEFLVNFFAQPTVKDQAMLLHRIGFTTADIAKALNLSGRTVREWLSSSTPDR